MKIAGLVGVVTLLVLGAVGGAAGQGRAPVPGKSALGFVSGLSLTGVAADLAVAFARTYLDAMRWQP